MFCGIGPLFLPFTLASSQGRTLALLRMIYLFQNRVWDFMLCSNYIIFLVMWSNNVAITQFFKIMEPFTGQHSHYIRHHYLIITMKPFFRIKCELWPNHLVPRKSINPVSIIIIYWILFALISLFFCFSRVWDVFLISPSLRLFYGLHF